MRYFMAAALLLAAAVARSEGPAAPRREEDWLNAYDRGEEAVAAAEARLERARASGACVIILNMSNQLVIYWSSDPFQSWDNTAFSKASRLSLLGRIRGHGGLIDVDADVPGPKATPAEQMSWQSRAGAAWQSARQRCASS